MREVDNIEIAEIIEGDPTIKYVATAMSPWHAIGVAATVRSLNLEHSRGLIVICPSHTSGQSVISHESFVALDSDNYQLVTYKPLRSLNKLKVLLSSLLFIFKRGKKGSGRRLYILSPEIVNIQLATVIDRHIPNIEIEALSYDEGVGTYFSKSVKRVFEESRSPWGVYINRYSDRIYSKLHGGTNTHLFKKRKGGLEVNREVVPHYKEAVEHSSGGDVDALSIFSNRVVICTSAWKRHLVKGDVDTNLVLAVADILHSKGIEFVIKLHPRDTWGAQAYSRYADSIFTGANISMETIASSLDIKPKAIIGLSTTVLVTANLFWEIPVINIAEILDKSALGDTYIDETSDFVSLFGQYVESPQSLDQFTNIISSIK